LLVSPGPQLLQEPSVDLGSLLLGHLYASRPPKSTCVYPVGEDGDAGGDISSTTV
jgi:hypothetical protein